MECKFCGAQMDEAHKFCPFCGKTQEEQTQQVFAESDTCECEEALEQVSVEKDICDSEEGLEQTQCNCDLESQETIVPEKPKKNTWVLVTAIAGAVIALAALAVVLLVAMGVDLKPRANDIYRLDSYTFSDEKAAQKADTVVATVADKQLTNAQLQIYYRMQVMDFLNYYSSYLSTLGLDYTKPLDEQTCYYDKTMTWEQYLLNISIQTWQNYQTLAVLAEQSGFTISDKLAENLANLPEDLNEQAVAEGYESAEAMLQELVGTSCTMDVYMQYITLSYTANEFYAQEYERMMPDQAEVEAYFTEKEATFQEQGITKDGKLISDVRHILICPKATEVEGEESTLGDAEWADCFSKAEEILNTWKSGEATEQSFADLAKEYTEDGGSQATGGLYQNVAPGSNYVEEFLNWAIDPARKAGDTEIVKTQFGYHIMYFVKGEPYWLYSARNTLITEKTDALIADGKAQFPMKVTYKKICMPALDLA